MNKKRVVITGLGVISPLGLSVDLFWKNIIAGKSGIDKVRAFDTTDFRCHYGAEVKDFNPNDSIDRRKVAFLGRSSQLAIAATKQALEDAGINSKNINKLSSAVVMGTTMGERALEDSLTVWIKEGSDYIDKNMVMQSMINAIALNIGFYFKVKPINMLIPTACSAGNYSIGYGFDLINNGEVDLAIVGGADSFSKIAFAGFQRLYAMSSDKCRPFDKNRKGMVLGEGSGVLILEELESARQRKAQIYAEVLGYGLSCDAYHITAPHRRGIRKAMEKALKESRVTPKDIDYISAHGTGTVQNDKEEAGAINQLFGNKTPASSIKSMIGHCMGAASAIESVACCLAIKEGIIPPTINFETPDPDCDIDCVSNQPREASLKTVLKNAFAFGGNNCCVVYKKID